MRRVIAAVAAVVLGALAGCSANSQSTTGSGGSATGTTLHIIVEDQIGVLIGGELLGSSSTGFDRIDGDLKLQSPGLWKGTVLGTADRTMTVAVLGDACETKLVGTQLLEAIATTGTFAEGRNLRIALSPLEDPSYATPPQCSLSQHYKAENGKEWLYFHLDAYRDAGMEVKLPPSPGGTWTWAFAPDPDPSYPGGCGGIDFVRCTHKTTLTVEYR
jgi:hypothetical protein